MDEKFTELLLQVHELFMKNGIKSMTMDDIARELKISKKTLYKFVSDKGDLVLKVMDNICLFEEHLISEITRAHDNAIDELVEIWKHISIQVKQIHPSIHYDLEKYYPEAWSRFNEHKENFIFKCVLDNLSRGTSQGFYRENMNAKIIAKLYISKIDIVFDASIFPATEFSFMEVHEELMWYHLKGISNAKGIKYLQAKLKKEQISL